MTSQYENYLRGALAKVVFNSSLWAELISVNWIEKMMAIRSFVVYNSSQVVG